MSELSRRTFLSGSAACAAALGVDIRRAFTQGAGRPNLHAMIVGINAYTGRVGTGNRGSANLVFRAIKPLRGCINDARTIEQAVKPLARSTRILLDREVTRAAFIRIWNDMVQQSQPGDTLLVTYSGHGGRETGHPVAPHAPDGARSTFILSSFDSGKVELSGERLLDDEAQSLWRSVQGRNTVIFVADSCHSGGMTRSIDLRAEEQVTFRSVSTYDIMGELPKDDKIPPNPTNLEVPHVVFLSGSEQHELVPEVAIGGRYHGALSYAFARALAGEADANKDGIVTGSELSKYVLRSVRAYSDSSQHPNIRWPNADVRFGMRPESPLLYLGSQTRPAPEPATNQVRLIIQGMPRDRAEQIGAGLKQAVVVQPPQSADFIWDAATGDVIDQLGSLMTAGIQAADLQSIVDRTATLALLRKLVANSGLDMRLLQRGDSPDAPPSRDSDRRYKRKEEITVSVRGLKHPSFVLFNIAGDGTVQFLDNGSNLRPDAPFSMRVEVAPPFGADHAVMINAARPLRDWVGLLSRLDKQRNCRAVSEALEREVGDRDVVFGMQGIFTAES
jgi:hypothetical protein